MSSVNDQRLNFNSKVQVNFNGGELSSDGGIILMEEFMHQTGVDQILSKYLPSEGLSQRITHTPYKNLKQLLFQIMAAYNRDDDADELTKDPVFNSLLDGSPAAQPTLSRFMNRFGSEDIKTFNNIEADLRKIMYSIKMPEYVMFDIDSTLLPTYGKQEGAGYNYHYDAEGYHPQLVFDALTASLLKVEMRDGSDYCGKDAASFMKPLFQEYTTNYPNIQRCLRADSGFAMPELYDLCEDYDCDYVIRLKENAVLLENAGEEELALYEATRRDAISYAVVYGEFTYQAKSWKCPRRVVFKIEKPYNKIQHEFMFIVTSLEKLAPYQVIQLYCGRGKMENFIQECKGGFYFASVSSHKEVTNAIRLQIHALAYNLFNWFRQLVLPLHMRKLKVDTIRLRLFKIAMRAVKSARYITMKLCSSCPYQNEFYETLDNIHRLHPQLE